MAADGVGVDAEEVIAEEVMEEADTEYTISLKIIAFI
jgi:hypothetical protein